MTRGRYQVSVTDQAQQNREYVRRMLKEKQPGFAAVLELVVWELVPVSDAPPGALQQRRGAA